MGGKATLLLAVAMLATSCCAHPTGILLSSSKAEAEAASEAAARAEAANSYSTSHLGADGVRRDLSVDSKARAEAEAKARAKANAEVNQELITLPNGQVGTDGEDVQKPVTAAEESDELKPPTREGGTEHPEDDMLVLVDGQGRCYYGGRGQGWYGGGFGGGNWGYYPYWG